MDDNYPEGISRFKPLWEETDLDLIPEEGDDEYNLPNIDEEELELLIDED